MSEVVAILLGSVIGGIFAALSAYVSVRATLKGQEEIENAKRQAELAAVRLALHTEVGTIGRQCLMEYQGWSAAMKRSGVGKNPRTAFLPPLAIYNSNASNIGRLSREEIVALVGFAGTIADISVLAHAMIADEISQPPDTLVQLFSNACGKAAECLNALPIPDADKDKSFIAELLGAGR